MTKEEILEYFKDINFMYNNPNMHDTLSRMIDELNICDGKWIPVAERVPEEYGEFMITWTTSHSMARKTGLIGYAEYEVTGEWDAEHNRFKGEWLLEEYVKNYPDVKVTAWMPLPEPYKGENE